MGLDYAYRVYVRQESARAVLETVKADCRHSTAEFTTIEFADGRVVMPCTSRFASGTTIRVDTTTSDAADMISLDLSLLFPEDDELLEWADCPDDDVDGRRLCGVGYIYLSVWDASTFLPGHLCFVFTAATTDMSRLFVRSPSIREWFSSLTFAHGGPLCLLDLEEKGCIVLTLGSLDYRPSVDWSGLYI